MAKLTRVFQKLFGGDGDASHFEQFGARATGTPFYTKDPNSLQALSAFTQNGWLDAINASNKAPFLEDMNGLFLLLFRQIAYGFQEGVPEWDAGTTYYTGGIVKKTGTFELYGSLIDTNTGNALPSQADNGFWKYLNPPSVPAGVMTDFGGSAAPLGWLLCDGTVYSQAAYPALYAAVGSTWNIGGEGAGNFRVPDIRGRATIGAGQGSGLTNRTLATLLGEETHVLVTGEMPVHSHTVNDPGHDHFQRIANASTGLESVQGVTGDASTIISHTRTDNIPTGVTINSAGGGGAHNNMQPSAVVTKIIKY